jgi:hypothetical protein
MYDYATIKYNTHGDQQWINFYNGDGSSVDEPVKIISDSSFTNIYVTGRSVGVGNKISYDYATICYNAANGEELWTARYNGLNDGYDEATSITIDNKSGSIYVTGSSEGNNSSWDYVTIQYDTKGEAITETRYVENINKEYMCLFADVNLDKSGNVYVSGLIKGDDFTLITTIKYNEDDKTSVKKYTNKKIDYYLSPNYPNPFNCETLLDYYVPNKSMVSIEIFNVKGQHIKTLLNNDNIDTGHHTVKWNGTNENGCFVSSGIYMIVFKADDIIMKRKIMLIK